MTELNYWVIHSPYPDKSWRGIEKCSSADLSKAYPDANHYNLLLFETEQEAQLFIGQQDLWGVEPVEVKLVVPNVRGKL